MDVTYYDYIVFGCGYAGAVLSRELAEKGNKRVLIIEKRDHTGGNAYDFFNDDGILIHKYGPHIFHTNSKRVFEYLSRFTKWRNYEHKVAANVFGTLMPVPFNINSLYTAFGEETGKKLELKLISTYGLNKKVTILDLKQQHDPELIKVADYVYENIFLRYTQKQWGLSPEDIDPSVTARVPVFISHDSRYFQDKYQGIPEKGYTSMFSNLLDHPNIEIMLNMEAAKVLKVENRKISVFGCEFKGSVIYTGPIDELFDCRFGRLPYRTLDFEFETHPTDYFQGFGTVNYTVDENFTRITEFKHLTGQKSKGKTTIVKEFPREYTGVEGEIPYYAVLNPDNNELYEKYRKVACEIPNFYLLGRLAEYKYYNMDAIAEKALSLGDELNNRGVV